MKNFALFRIVFLTFFAFLPSLVVAEDIKCRPSSASIDYKEVPNTDGLMYVEGKLAEFDPCHRSVSFSKPSASGLPTIIVLHGGGGLTADIKNAVETFRKEGYGTLMFDAFSMNDRWKGWQYWAYRVNNESRQRMLYKVALGAYDWVTKEKNVSAEEILFYGVSNGATVVANLAATESAKAKHYFAEGMPGMGIGLPDKVIYPLTLFYGSLDNYAGLHDKEWTWIRQDYCILNTDKFEGPLGNAKDCSKSVNLGNLTEQPIKWVNRKKEEGYPLDVVWLEGAGHSIFAGPLKFEKISFGKGRSTRPATLGGPTEAVGKVLEVIKSKAN